LIERNAEEGVTWVGSFASEDTTLFLQITRIHQTKFGQNQQAHDRGRLAGDLSQHE
jgi:hypothetical protein